MKSIPKTADYKRFEEGLRKVLTVSKTELQKREKQYLAERAGKPKRGPKPKASASGRASVDKD